MVMTKQSVVITLGTPGNIQVAIANETLQRPIAEIIGIWEGLRGYVHILDLQFHMVLQAAGLNPRNATLAQLKAEIEAHTYWWGN